MFTMISTMGNSGSSSHSIRWLVMLPRSRWIVMSLSLMAIAEPLTLFGFRPINRSRLLFLSSYRASSLPELQPDRYCYVFGTWI